jgi:hypothetical protein
VSYLNKINSIAPSTFNGHITPEQAKAKLIDKTPITKGDVMSTNPRHMWKIRAGHCYGGSNDKVYLVVIDDMGNGHHKLTAYAGKRTGGLVGYQKCTGSLSVCESEGEKLWSEKKYKKGYEDVESPAYNVPANARTNLLELMAKIDCTRIVGYAAKQTPPGTKPPKYTNQPATETFAKKETTAKPAQPAKLAPVVGRVGRQIRI